MILVDYRQGSHELVAPLKKRGLPVEETTLDFGDLAFLGRGADGAEPYIGIEYKKLGELLTSMQTGRLQGHQLIGMRHVYDYSWLLIEGEFRFNEHGRILKRVGHTTFRPFPGRLLAGEFQKQLFTLQHCAGLQPLWAATRAHTLFQIEMLYRFWTDKALDEHRSHLVVYEPPTLVPVSQFRRTLQTLPGIGPQVSLAAERNWQGDLLRALSASVEEWADLLITNKTGARKLGRKTAALIRKATYGDRE